jgi:hypothetical protein
MGQMTPETSRMVGNLSGNPVPFLIPIILTIILLFRHPISFAHKKLWKFVGIMFFWSVAVCFKFHDFSSGNLSYYFFLFYAIFIAYIHVRVYRRCLFFLYEHIMVRLSAISLVLWGIHMLLPFSDSIFRAFPATAMEGTNVLYIYQWTDTIRNSGSAWEPGRFAIMLIPAILINLSRRGVTFYKNKNAIILLAALVSTFSTTGYSIAILLYVMYWFKKFTVHRIVFFFVFVLPLCVYLFSLDFMSEKIQDRAEFEGLTKQNLAIYEYHAEKSGNEYVGSIDRFESAFFDWLNFQEEPLLGYGRNSDYSWFSQKISTNFVLTSGFVKILSQHGAVVGVLLYIILFFSSFKISRMFPHQRKFAFALALMLCSVSYSIFVAPIFMAFWFYGLFCYNKKGKHILRDIPTYWNNHRFHRTRRRKPRLLGYRR